MIAQTATRLGTPKPLYSGPAILSGSFKVFFLSAALWAVAALVFWLMYIASIGGDLGAQQNMLMWHAHELIYGYGGAVVAGFAFTAIPNWTGRTPLRGFELGLLYTPWLITRITATMLLFGYDLEGQRAIAEMAFYGLFVLFAMREIIAGKNWRNLKIIVVFSALLAAAFAANLQRLGSLEYALPGWQAGLVVILLLICIIGGRIIPAFTRNWMKREGIKAEPTMFNKFDAGAILAALVTLVAYSAGLSGLVLVALAGLTALLHFARLYRWKGWLTIKSPIVMVLHMSYLWIPLGFLLLALSETGIISDITALHAWTVGGIGSTTLAVMTRASLGHSGQPLIDGWALTSIYIAVNVAAFSRVLASIWFDQYEALLSLSGILWCMAFLLFVAKFAPNFFRR